MLNAHYGPTEAKDEDSFDMILKTVKLSRAASTSMFDSALQQAYQFSLVTNGRSFLSRKSCDWD